MNCLRRHSCWPKKDYWQGAPGGKQQGKGTQEKCFATWLSVSGFMVMKLVSRLSLACHLACAHIWSDSGSFLVSCASLSQNGFLVWGFLGGWQDILWAGTPLLPFWPLRIFSAHMWSGLYPWPQEQEKMWSAYLLFKQGSVVISCSEASRGDCLELLSLGPIYLLPQSQALKVCVMGWGGHTNAFTLTCVDLSAERMSGEGVLFIKS